MKKRNYSYFIIKPDGMRFLDEICDTLEGKYNSIRYYAIDDFAGIVKKLYHKYFEIKGKDFEKSFQSYLYGVNEIFGNQAILVLIADSTKQPEELMTSVYQTKMEIRKRHVNDNIGIVTNFGEGQKDYIRIVAEDGTERAPRIMNTWGTHRINNINIIHCPDPNKEDTLGELKILFDQGVIDDKNLIMDKMMKQMRRYQTAKFQRDMSERWYAGPIQPDISGFIKSELGFSEDEEELLK